MVDTTANETPQAVLHSASKTTPNGTTTSPDTAPTTHPAAKAAALRLANPTVPFIPNLSYSFSATVNLGELIGPIPLIGGGVRVIQAITGGTISGPGFNATVLGGHAAPTIIPNGDGTVVQSPYIYAYGHASDGSPFYLEEKGVGNHKAQNTHLLLNVSGQYRALQTAYIIGEVEVTADGRVSIVQYYTVPLPPGKENGAPHAEPAV